MNTIILMNHCVTRIPRALKVFSVAPDMTQRIVNLNLFKLISKQLDHIILYSIFFNPGRLKCNKQFYL